MDVLFLFINRLVLSLIRHRWEYERRKWFRID